jgi:hypothetical protein
MHTLEIAKEYWDRDKEEEIVREIMRFLSKSLGDQYGTKKYFRRFHARSLGLLHAKLKVSDHIPTKYRVGLFEVPRTYDAWVRFSLGSRTDTGDHRRGLKGMSIKILDVDTAPIESNGIGNTHDILLSNNKIIFPGTPSKQLAAMKAIFTKRIRLKIVYFFKSLFPITGFLRFLSSIMNTQNCLNTAYFSGTPFQFGNGQAVKWKVEPGKSPNAIGSKLPRRGDKNFVRRILQQDILKNEFSYDLFIQPQEDPYKQPIENGAVLWKTEFIKVATITLPKQDFNTTERQASEESIVFNPWNCMPEHQPLGGINRLRGPLYTKLSKERAEHNNEPEFNINVKRETVLHVDLQKPGIV